MTETEALALLESLPEDKRAEVIRLSQFLRAKPPSFCEFAESTSGFEAHPWQRDHLFPILEELATGKGVRYLVHGPPQFGKSMWAEERLPAYFLGINPLGRVRTACYNIKTAADFGSVVKLIMESEEYAKWFGKSATPAGGGSEKFWTQARLASASGQPSFRALGLETGLVGSGPDLLIIGDPYSGPEQVVSQPYAHTLKRFLHSGLKPRVRADTNILILYHRWHGADLATMAMDANLGFKVVRFPGLADGGADDPTDREIGEPLSPLRTKEELEQWKTDDPSTFYALCQGAPLPDEGKVFNRDDFGIVDEAPPLVRWYRGWDFASSIKETADYTAGALIGVDRDLTIYIKDVTQFRAEFPDARKTIIQTAQIDGKDVPLGIEEKVAGLAMVQDLMRCPELLGHQIIRIPAKGDKKQRASGWAARARAGKLKLVHGDWNLKFINQCCAFDGLGLVHDDMVDAVSGAWHLLQPHQGGTVNPNKPLRPGSKEFYDALRQGHT